MSSRVTDLDRSIAKRIKLFREEAKLTQPQVAGHLGVAYQSYQRMEAGRHSFRASTLDKLATLYNKRLFDFMADGEVKIDPLVTKAQLLLLGMNDDDRETCIRAILQVKHGAAQ